MERVTGLLAVASLCLVASGRGTEADGGYCAGTRCFAAFRAADGGFADAQAQCGLKGGHLMTVPSYDSRDIVSILLANATGSFWIGLKLAGACPDAQDGALRGFQWVTKDTRSDVLDWASGFDGSCPSSRGCVSVSREGGFHWTQEDCGRPGLGFLCEYSFSEPCRPLEAGPGDAVIYVTPMGFRGEDLLSLPPGSIATRVPSETKHVCFSERWLPAPWNCEIAEGGCEHRCAKAPVNEPRCYCPRGQSVSRANNVTCEVDAHDPCLGLGCQHACYDAGDAHACACDRGFRLAADGRSCTDVNGCADERQCPGEHQACVNATGGFQCVCAAGYAATGGGRCADEDECLSAPCEHKCENLPGGFACSCYDGYRVDAASPDKCRLHCGRHECPAECDPNDAFVCYCPDGYVSEERGARVHCIDIDECEFGYCDQGCRNTYGGYVCSCSPGYQLVGEYTCSGIEGYTSSPEEEATATATATAPPDSPRPGPTRRPSSGVSVGAFVGIIASTAFCVVALVCVAHRALNRRCASAQGADALKAHGAEVHGLQNVGSARC